MKDSDIRQIMLLTLDQQYKNDPDTIIIEELGLCQGESRIDIAVVNGSIHGFEIKSNQDTLRRLAGQVSIYSRVLDSITLVVGSEHLDEALKIIPKWWGVVVAKEREGQVYLHKKRKGRLNPGPDPFAVAQLLWREEALQVLKEHDLHRGIVSKPRTILWKKLAENLPTDELMDLVRGFLKSRGNWRSGYQQV
jgi:hypothetical protein